VSIAPDRNRAVEQYRAAAATYDRHMWFARGTHREAVERLDLEPGQVVVDVACGTGLNFERIEDRIGAGGHLIGVDLSPEMLALARERVETAGWDNVTLLEAPAEEAALPTMPDALLFAFAHDVLRSPAALDNLLARARSGARVVAAGGKWPPRWAVPVHAYVRFQAPRFVSTMEGFDRPWTLLGERVRDLDVRQRSLGGAYVASGQAL
jgi:demethylmenaquinone methyltransferase/2-methoxy-6-polyprenyl-1,4-benzoquinol methylase